MVPLTQKVIFLLIPDFAVLGHIFILYISCADSVTFIRVNLCKQTVMELQEILFI